MNSVYSSELHKFVESYLNLHGAHIEEKHEHYFTAVFPDGKKEIYTYAARVASENKDIKLLAKGSKALTSMLQHCNSKAAFSELFMTYTEETVKLSLKVKSCCDLCPFFSICENGSKCCDFCYYFKCCNTSIKNGEFLHFGDIKKTEKINAICFIFSVELSNDYSLSQKIEKLITVLVDLDTGKIINNIHASDIVNLKMEPSANNTPIGEDLYHRCLSIARKEASNIMKDQLEVFRNEIQDHLGNKIKLIMDKYEEEYIENYTKSSLEQLEQLQNEGLKLCEREIRGYAINCDYHLKNVIILHTSRDIRELAFKLENSNTEVKIPAEIFLSQINLYCSRCGNEIDEGLLCSESHILCKNCAEICVSCNKTICYACDHENYICSTCGEAVCTECAVKCTSCGAILCPDHAYHCANCGNVFCIDCHEICSICENNICNEHLVKCKKCNEPVCSEHTGKCDTCGDSFCTQHLYSCSICGKKMCADHSFYSDWSKKSICMEHVSKCSACSRLFSPDEVTTCTICGDKLCPSHVRQCSKCKKDYCNQHINHCKCCGDYYCDCTPNVTCRLCGHSYCVDCINADGYCTACSELVNIDPSSELVKDIIQKEPQISHFKKFYIGKSSEINVLYAKSLFSSHVVVFDNHNMILDSRKLSIIDAIKTKNNISRKQR